MTDRLRVLYLSGWPIGAHGEGAVSFVYEQIEALAVVVDAVYADVRFESLERYAGRILSGTTISPIRNLWPDGVKAVDVRVPRWSTRVTRRTLLEDVWRAGVKVARRLVSELGPFDLVHAHVVLPAGLMGAGIATTLNVPLVLQEHSAPFEMHLDTQEKQEYVQRVLRVSRVVAAVGDDLARRIEAFCDEPRKIQVTPNMLRTDLFLASAIPDERGVLRLVSVASLDRRKAIDTLLDAMALLKGMRKSVKLRIVGNGELRDDLARQVTELGLAEDVAFMGALSRRDTARAIAESHIYVCSSRHETFGLALAEAISSGRPVVSTQCGGPEEFVDDSCGALVAIDDPRAMSEAILRTWNRLDEFDPIAMHERVDARFGPDAFRRRVRGLYDVILGDRAAA
jgi:glycosyltransferase involved in cell wall biosynthesis